MSSQQYRLLFVCMGNICRSPTAEAVMRRLAYDAGRGADFVIDGAGTGSWHIGQPPDARARAAAALRGYELGGYARAVNNTDFVSYDLILAVDEDNFARLKELAPTDTSAEIRKLDHDDVPDPYYGGQAGFTEVLNQIEQACRRLLAELTG